MLNLTGALKIYAAKRHARLQSLNASETQTNQLLYLLKAAQNTKIGREYDFKSIRTVSEYQSRVPVRTYEQTWNEYWKPAFPHLTDCTWPGTVPYFAVSSGTSSGTTKYLPCTKDILRSNAKAGMDLPVFHILNKPKSRIFSGMSFMLGGSTDLKVEAPGIYSGDLSGITVKELPWWAKPRYFPPLHLSLIKDWEEKIQTLGAESLKRNITMFSGIPAWMILFIERTAELIGKPGASLNEIYPNLELISHGGVNFAPYLSRFKNLLGNSSAELREVYPASEGFIGVADRGYGEGLKLSLDNQIFFEFVPLDELGSSNPTRHWVDTIEKDINYAIVLTTCAGLWSYIIGDTVRFVETTPPRLLVTGRTTYYLSAFGEHLIGEEIEYALSQAAEDTGLIISDYSVGSLFPSAAGELGGHLYVVEFLDKGAAATAQEKFLTILDAKLIERNEDYEVHRSKGFGLNPPKMIIAPTGTFKEWMRSRGKLGGQNKVPRIINDQTLFESLRKAAS